MYRYLSNITGVFSEAMEGNNALTRRQETLGLMIMFCPTSTSLNLSIIIFCRKIQKLHLFHLVLPETVMLL